MLLTYGIGAGLANMLAFIAAGSLVPAWFSARRSYAQGWAFTGSGMSNAILPPVLHALVEAWGWWMARWLRAHARTGGIGEEVIPGEARLAARLAGARPLEQWVELWDRLSARLRQALSANLDRKQVLITVVAEFAAASG